MTEHDKWLHAAVKDACERVEQNLGTTFHAPKELMFAPILFTMQAALAARPATPQPEVQSGWALYPKEPTQAMRDAYDRAPGPGTGWWAWKVMTEAAPPPPAAAEGNGENEWRCFHCGDVFTTHESAMEHFGPSQFEEPACKIDIAKFREMEENHRRHCSEDSDSDREFHSMRARHVVALREEDEKGYARGLADARKYPETLGLQPLPPAPEMPE